MIDTKKFHPDFKRVFELFKQKFGLKLAFHNFKEFIEKNGLNPQLPYHPQIQFESFQWVTPLIEAYKTDNEAKYYKVTALHAIISMNNKDYRDIATLRESAPSLSWRPVNLNHDYSKFLPFPRTRIDTSSCEDWAIEAVLRVDNHDKWLQEKLDNQEILHPSIEARKWDGKFTFMALALLERGKHLPGDPLSEIKPLFVESVQFCDLKPKISEKQRLLKIIHEQSTTIANQSQTIQIQKESITKAHATLKRLKGIAKSMAQKLNENLIIDVTNDGNILDYNKSISEACENENLRESLRGAIFEIQGTKYRCDAEGCLQEVT